MPDEIKLDLKAENEERVRATSEIKVDMDREVEKCLKKTDDAFEDLAGKCSACLTDLENVKSELTEQITEKAQALNVKIDGLQTGVDELEDEIVKTITDTMQANQVFPPFTRLSISPPISLISPLPFLWCCPCSCPSSFPPLFLLPSIQHPSFLSLIRALSLVYRPRCKKPRQSSRRKSMPQRKSAAR